MFVAIIVAIILATACAFLTNTIFKNWIDNKYTFMEALAKDYIIDEAPVFSVSVTDSEVDSRISVSEVSSVVSVSVETALSLCA